MGKLSKHQLLFEDLATALAQIGRLETARELAEAFWLAPMLPPTAKQQPQMSEPIGSSTSQRLQNLDAKVLENDAIPPEDSAPPPPADGMLLPVDALPELGDLPVPIQIWLEDPPLLEQPLSLLRALAPLQTLPVASLRLRLDEAATVEQSVRQPMLRPSNRQRQLPVLQPVLRPLLEARFELLLVVDGGVTMWVWERLVTELQRLFNSGAVFRGVKVIPIAFDEGGAPQLPRLLASSLVAERTLLLLLSDCQGSHWWSGEMSLHLRRWSARLPLAVLQVLPRHLWRLTALGGKDPLRLTNSRAAQPSERYLSPPQTKSSRPSRFRRAAPAFTGPVVPVISCDATSLGHWSAVVMGDPRSSVAGFRLPAPGEAVKPPNEDPEAQWRQFCNFASPQAHKLAGLLAAAPVITLPVMRLVKKALMPQTLAQSDNTPMPIAEVLSGLLQPIPARENGLIGKLPHEHVQFEFKPGLQSRLREQISAADTIAVVKAVSTLLERRLNRVAPGQDFRALLTDPNVLPPPGLEGIEAFATLTAERIESLGGVYAEYAAQLRAGANKAGLPVDVDLPADMQSIALQRSHRTPVVWITTFDDDKKIFSFGTDGTLCIWEPKNIRLYETSLDLNLSYLNPLSRLNLNDFHDDEAFASFRFFKLDKSMFVIRKTGGLFLYEILSNSSATSYFVETKYFHIYNMIRPSYEPVSVIKSKYLGYVFGCMDGRIIHVSNDNKTSFDFYTRQACKNGSVEFLYEININQLLCWPSTSSNEEVFSICNFQLDMISSFKIKPDDFEKLSSGRSAFKLIRPLRIWKHERNIAISHSNYIVSIWKWDDRKAELELLHYLEGHTSIVNDLIQLDNGNYVTISDDKTIRNWEYSREVQMLNGNILFTSDYELKTFTKCELYEITILAIGDEQGNIHWMKIS